MSTLSEVYRDNPLHPQHIIPLDFESAHTVPESHIWPETNDFQHSGWSNGELSIPVIDLMDPNVVEHIGHACETWGMFQVIGHGVCLSLLEEVEAEARRLFELPARQKMKALRSPGGATGYGTARITPFFSKNMWHEGFTIMGSCVDHAKELWPRNYKRFCDTMVEYQKKMKALAYQLWLLVLKSLDIQEKDVTWAASLQHSEAALQLNSYPCCPDPDRVLGLAPHTDTLLLTIVHQSDSNGLQVFKDGVLGWVSVSPIAGALVVNVGDLLHIVSNARFLTAYHRVVANQACHRVSIAYFYGPPAESELVPILPKLQAPCYRSLTVKEYVSVKAKHLEKALSLIRI
ncbi:unnamed protein product [Ilex paraguariensis]|uniref:gibberellin 3beta-dioxygenase n=1 Tax=Ilex paraguariensis TaxID=185542 RepID=A0ABC8UWP5_9AQUA